jgi:DNA-binding MarR family transcriptional regulator
VLEETMGYALWDTTRRTTREFHARVARVGISVGIFPFMRVLHAKGDITQRELAQRVGMRGSTTVQAVQDMERRGLICRRADPADRRKAYVSLTAEGRALYEAALPEVAALNQKMLTGFTRHEERLLRQFLKRVRDNMGMESSALIYAAPELDISESKIVVAARK